MWIADRWSTPPIVLRRHIPILLVLHHHRLFPISPNILAFLILKNLPILPPPTNRLVFRKEILPLAMKAIPLKLTNIIVPIHKGKPPLTIFYIFLVVSCVNVACEVLVCPLTMFQSTKKPALIHVAVWVVVSSLTLHQVVQELALVHGPVREFVYSLTCDGLVVELAFVYLCFDDSRCELVIGPYALHDGFLLKPKAPINRVK